MQGAKRADKPILKDKYAKKYLKTIETRRQKRKKKIDGVSSRSK